MPMDLRSEQGVTRFEVRVPPSLLIQSETPHDPYTRRTRWPLQVETEAWTANLFSVGGRVPLTLVDADQMLSLQTTPGQQLEAVHQPACVQAITVELSADSLVVHGLWFTPTPPSRMRWRRFLAATDDPVDVEATLHGDAPSWSAVVACAELVDGLGDSLEGSSVLAHWVLTATTELGTAAVQCTGAAGMTLPLESVQGSYRLKATMVRETLHVEVRRRA
jgi:hypothetical protein